MERRVLLEGLRYALEQRYDAVQPEPLDHQRRMSPGLHVLTDQGFFQRSLIVASAHNMPVELFPGGSRA